MSSIKKQFKNDLEEKMDVDLSFEHSKLEKNVKVQHRLSPARVAVITSLSAAGLLITAPVVLILAATLRTISSVKTTTKKYSVQEIKMAERNTFKPLNSVTYPDQERPARSTLSTEEMVAYNNYVSAFYQGIISSNSASKNYSFSPINAYSILNELALASSRDELTERFNSLLGLDEEGRRALIVKAMKANSYGSESNTTQIKNSAFFTNEYPYNQDYVNKLTNLYCEAYQLDFSKDLDKMLEWAEKATNTKNFIDEKFLGLDEESVIVYFSTIYFKNAWQSKYIKSNNIKDKFYLSGDVTTDVTYMKHSYDTTGYYDYGKYISFSDYYYQGQKVTYIVPKEHEDDIYELTKGINIFEEDNDKFVTNEHQYIMVNLKTPKFSLSCESSFIDALKNIGFEDIFNRNINSFNGAFDHHVEGDNFYLQKMKQKNSAEFNEDGSIVKSLTMAVGGMARSAAMTSEAIKTLDVSLDQPFIYIIRDINGLPIYVGHVDNPNG